LKSILPISSKELLYPVHSPSCPFARFDGQLILPYMTPQQLGIEDGDIIDVYVSRPSGTGKRGRSEEPEEQREGKRGMEMSWIEG
jgi:hypothetical protein